MDNSTFETLTGQPTPGAEQPGATPTEAAPDKAAQAAQTGQTAQAGQTLTGVEQVEVYDKVVEALRTCYDPEIPVNIYELGLIYEVKVEPSAEVLVKMTLTTPNCPAAASLPGEVRYKVEAVPRVAAAKVDVVWEPPWDPSKMTEAARLQLGMF